MRVNNFNAWFALVTFAILVGGIFYLAHRDRDKVVTILPITDKQRECFDQCSNNNKLRGDNVTENCWQKCRRVK